jgi:hypothetical protein
MRLFCLKFNTITTSEWYMEPALVIRQDLGRRWLSIFFLQLADQADDFQSKKAFGKHLGCQ